MFSKACEYGIRSTILIFLYSLHNTRVGLGEIAHKIQSPEAYTAKILQTLVKSNIVKSIKGRHGGFEIDPGKMDTLMLKDIVQAIDGDQLLTNCCMGLLYCSDQNPCPAHNKYKVVKDQLENMLDNTTVYEMAIGYEMGLSELTHKNNDLKNH